MTGSSPCELDFDDDAIDEAPMVELVALFEISISFETLTRNISDTIMLDRVGPHRQKARLAI